MHKHTAKRSVPKMLSPDLSAQLYGHRHKDHRQKNQNLEDMDSPEKIVYMQEQPLLLDAGQFARLIGISRSNFYSLLSAGQIGPEPIHLGKRVLWKRAEVEAWVRSDCPPREKWLILKETEKILT